MRKTYWLKGSDTKGQFTSFWKMLCYKDNDEPVNGMKIDIDYREFNNI